MKSWRRNVEWNSSSTSLQWFKLEILLGFSCLALWFLKEFYLHSQFRTCVGTGAFFWETRKLFDVTVGHRKKTTLILSGSLHNVHHTFFFLIYGSFDVWKMNHPSHCNLDLSWHVTPMAHFLHWKRRWSKPFSGHLTFLGQCTWFSTDVGMITQFLHLQIHRFFFMCVIWNFFFWKFSSDRKSVV